VRAVRNAVDVTLVEQVRPEITYPLRQQVLRAGMAPEASFYPGDKNRSSGHFAAYLDDNMVGVVSVLAEPEPDDHHMAGRGTWRLRGMVVDPDHRGEGVGAALIARVRDFVQRSGGGLLWCNARATAEGFYLKMGFVRTGEPWEEPDIGGHVRMHDEHEPSSS
jgi:GNAT superfamily N-acetyltransferase